jgi:hypothetical protein
VTRSGSTIGITATQSRHLFGLRCAAAPADERQTGREPLIAQAHRCAPNGSLPDTLAAVNRLQNPEDYVGVLALVAVWLAVG